MTGASRFDRVFSVSLRRPVATLVAVAVVTVAALLAWPAVRFEPDVSRLLPADHEHVRIAALLDDRARPARTLWLLLRGEGLAERVPALAERLLASPDVVDVTTTRRALLEGRSERLATAPLWALEPSALARLEHALSPDGIARAVDDLLLDLADDPLAAGELARRDPLGLRWVLGAGDPLQQLGFRAGSELLLVGESDEDRRALLRLRGRVDAYDADFATALCGLVEREVAAAGLEAEVFGGYAIARADQDRIRGDFERASTWSVLMIALYLCAVMRGVRLPLLVQLPAMLSIVWAIPFGSLLFGALPTVAVAAVAVLCGLGVDFAIHYAARYRAARLSRDHEAAVRHVQRTTVAELLIDMATTAVTFLAIGAGVGAGGLRAFGLLLAIGLVGSVLFTIFALPVLLRWAGDRRDPERSAVAAAADRWLLRPAAPRTSWALLGLAALGVGYLLTTGVPLSAGADTLRPAHDPVAAARRDIEQRIGFATVPVLALWPCDRDASPLLAALERERDAGRVRFWSGLDRGETEAGRAAVAACRARIDGFVARAEQALVERGLDPAPLRAGLLDWRERLWAPPPAPAVTRLLHRGREHRVVELWPARRLDRAAFDRFADELQEAAGPAVVVHGGPTLTAALEGMLAADLARACWIAVTLALLLVTVWLRSLRLGLLALVPSSLGLVVTLVLLQLLDVPLTMISFVAVPFVLGIGVDEGVHLVGHFRHERGATGATGVGIVRTSVGTVLGFSALLLAESPGLQLLGGTVAFGSAASMLSCLFVLAPLLERAARRREGAS